QRFYRYGEATRPWSGRSRSEKNRIMDHSMRIRNLIDFFPDAMIIILVPMKRLIRSNLLGIPMHCFLYTARCTFVYTNGILEESQGVFAHSLGTRLCQIRTINSRKCFPASPQLVNISQSDDPISRYYQVAHEGEEG